MQRVAALERQQSRPKPGFDQALAKAIGAGDRRDDRSSFDREFEAKLAEIENARLKFLGVFEPGVAYAPNSLVIRKGSLVDLVDQHDHAARVRRRHLAAGGQDRRGQPSAEHRMTMDLETSSWSAIRPTIEADLDQQIEAEPDPEVRALMRRDRAVLIGKALDATRITNLQHRLAEAEARLRPRLVEEP